MTSVSLARPAATDLLTLARDLEPAASAGDLVDVLATGAGAKPLTGVTLCYTADGQPAWDAVDSSPDALGYDDLASRFDELGLAWRLAPVRSVTEDREYTWYDLLLALPDGEGASYLERAPTDPAARDARAYGRALGYPESAIDWFEGATADTDRTVLDVVRTARPDDPTALILAASVPYVPAPTPRGAADAVADGRQLVDALCRLGTAAGEPDYVRRLLAGRLPATVSHDEGGADRCDVLADAMPC